MKTPSSAGRAVVADLRTITLFLYRYGWYSYDPALETREKAGWRTARKLARALVVAAASGWRAQWRPDGPECRSCACGEETCACCRAGPHGTLKCVLRTRAGRELASLGGICAAEPDDERVVKAWLALQALSRPQRRPAWRY